MRWTLAVVGTAAALGGLAYVFLPGLGGGRAPAYLVVVAIAVFALVESARAAYERGGTDRERADLPAVERRRDHPTPGAGFDAVLSTPASQRKDREAAIEAGDRLEAAAVAVLTAEGYDEGEARAALAAGTWTDDPHAAAFFAEGAGASFSERVRRTLAGESAFRLQARHAAAELLARRERDA